MSSTWVVKTCLGSRTEYQYKETHLLSLIPLIKERLAKGRLVSWGRLGWTSGWGSQGSGSRTRHRRGIFLDLDILTKRIPFAFNLIHYHGRKDCNASHRFPRFTSLINVYSIVDGSLGRDTLRTGCCCGRSNSVISRPLVLLNFCC